MPRTWKEVLRALTAALRRSPTLRHLRRDLPRECRLLWDQEWPRWAINSNAIAVVEIAARGHLLAYRAIAVTSKGLTWLGNSRPARKEVKLSPSWSSI